jgi:hypothetical protein
VNVFLFGIYKYIVLGDNGKYIELMRNKADSTGHRITTIEKGYFVTVISEQEFLEKERAHDADRSYAGS